MACPPIGFREGIHYAAVEPLACPGQNFLLGVFVRTIVLATSSADQFLVGIRHGQNVSLDRDVDRTRSLILHDLLRDR